MNAPSKDKKIFFETLLNVYQKNRVFRRRISLRNLFFNADG